MCGIAGIWNFSRPRSPAPTADADAPARVRVEAMLDAMRHRGPDGRGSMEYVGGAAGMVRLALVDLSDQGQQPMWSADRRVAILFNGEVYNFREHRQRLASIGPSFHSTTDTEVVLRLYLERGRDCVHALRGMYALAIFDWRETGTDRPPQLFLARDPLGIKPLYVAELGQGAPTVVFASELRALLASGLVSRAICREGLCDYFATGRVWQPRTMLDQVRMLEAGCWELHTPGQPRRTQRFWSMPPAEPRDETLDAAAERLRALLDESVRLHALADAPVGAFLSGGIDSTGIVGLMRRHVSDLRTYTLRFPEFPDLNEADEAADAARQLGVRNTQVDVTGKELAELLPRFAAELDQPSTDGVNSWLVCRAAAREVKGVLSGLGGDEWFAGYPIVRRMVQLGQTRRGQWVGAAARAVLACAPRLDAPWYRERMASVWLRRSPLAAWIHAHALFHWEQAARTAGSASAATSVESRYHELLALVRADWRMESPIGLACLLDFRAYMGNQLLRDADATSMAHSLELRVPLVDQEIVRFSRSCRDEYKLSNGSAGLVYADSGAKRVLIHALRDVLPASIASRPKRGFVVPTFRWIKTDLADLVEACCAPEVLRRRGLADPDLLPADWRGFRKSRFSRLHSKLWALSILELWSRAVLDAPTRLAETSAPIYLG